MKKFIFVVVFLLIGCDSFAAYRTDINHPPKFIELRNLLGETVQRLSDKVFIEYGLTYNSKEKEILYIQFTGKSALVMATDKRGAFSIEPLNEESILTIPFSYGNACVSIYSNNKHHIFYTKSLEVAQQIKNLLLTISGR